MKQSILAVLALLFTFSWARGEDVSSRVQGLERLRAEVQEGLLRNGGSGNLVLGPWKVTYAGPVPAGNGVKLAVTPTTAFSTERSALNPTEFTVRLVAVSELFTPMGNLKEIGAEATFLSDCEVAVEFRSPYSGRKFDLEAIAARNKDAIALGWTPSDGARFLQYLGTMALVRRPALQSGRLPATLHLFDAGKWFSYTSEIPSCDEAGEAPLYRLVREWVTETHFPPEEQADARERYRDEAFNAARSSALRALKNACREWAQYSFVSKDDPRAYTADTRTLESDWDVRLKDTHVEGSECEPHDGIWSYTECRIEMSGMCEARVVHVKRSLL